MIWWLKRRKHRKRKLVPPPPRPSGAMARARWEARRAHVQLENAEAQQREITERVAPLEEALTSNNLGPKFWAAVAARKPKDA